MNPLHLRADPRHPWALLLALLLSLPVTGCRRSEPSAYQGYLEADLVHVGAPVPGTLLQRPVSRGSNVQTGDLLFVLESQAEAAAVDEATRRLAQARARLENLQKGRRPTEIAALEARVAQNQAALDLAESELLRRERLRREDVISTAELDVARAQRTAARATLEAAEAELSTARLGGREDEIRAAQAERDAGEAALARARWALDQKTQQAPLAGRVHDTYREPGEFVAAGSPVLSLLPTNRLKVRFFVPQADLPRLSVGTDVEIVRDGAPAPLRARISYVAERPEFTPPVIYSRATRTKLVFLAEAVLRPEDAAGLGPGQPVDVRRPGTAP